jgi:cation diffusion facilitator CzcD-associated flavoprotein CzcO
VVDKYRIAIVGAGPAGLSAAARAAELDAKERPPTPSYVLLEGFSAPAKTIQRYQKRKLVMDEPGFLDLRSDMRFGAGAREQVLENWSDDLRRLGVNIRYGAEVAKIAGERGAFNIRLANGEELSAENIVLAIGLEGNPRKVGARGEDLPGVQYQLDDPREFSDETILVVGAGDSGTLRLQRQNLLMLQAVAESIGESASAAELAESANALTRAGQTDAAAVRDDARKLSAWLNAREPWTKRTFSRAEISAVRKTLLAYAAKDRGSDFMAAEQVVLGVESLSYALGDHDKHGSDIDVLYNAVKTSGSFDPAQFAGAARQVAGHF